MNKRKKENFYTEKYNDALYKKEKNKINKTVGVHQYFIKLIVL